MTRQGNGLNSLYEMLSYARPHGSSTEAEFVRRWIQSIPGIGFDGFGNGLVCMGTAPVMWSCHTDTVHHKEGMQGIEVFKHKGKAEFAALAKKDQRRGMCLGADDGAGVWLMLNMIHARVPGLYVFHAGEEHGCLGSKWLTKMRPDIVDGIKFAIAFDRKGTDNIITHQMGERTCSDKFAAPLAKSLPAGYRADDSGAFTDTVEYTGLIGECTNISVGYEDAHSHKETLDLGHLLDLRDSLCGLAGKFPSWEMVREPGEIEAFDMPGNDNWQRLADRVGGAYHDETLVEMITCYPEIAARLIRSLGGGSQDMLDALDRDGYDTDEFLN